MKFGQSANWFHGAVTMATLRCLCHLKLWPKILKFWSTSKIGNKFISSFTERMFTWNWNCGRVSTGPDRFSYLHLFIDKAMNCALIEWTITITLKECGSCTLAVNSSEWIASPTFCSNVCADNRLQRYLDLITERRLDGVWSAVLGVIVGYLMKTHPMSS